MTDAAKAMSAFRRIDEYSSKKTALSSLNPLSHLIVTLGLIVAVLSFGRYEVVMLVPFVIYPFIIPVFGDIPMSLIAKRVLVVLPAVILLGGFNPVFDNTRIFLGGIAISAGWFSFLSLIIKCMLTVSSTLILICVIGIDGVCAALYALKIPVLIIAQLSFTYRYIHVLGEEIVNVLFAYRLRSPMSRGVSVKQFGSMCGSLFLRSAKRAEDVYSAMRCRGFDGHFRFAAKKGLRLIDFLYILLWLSFFILARFFNLPQILGNFLLLQ